MTSTFTCLARRNIPAAALALCGLLPLQMACSPADAPAPPPPEVGVLTVASAAVPLNFTYTARMRGEREVEVRAKVSGILLKRHFREGAAVKAGELLFEIDPAEYEAEVRSAEGRVGVEQARLAEAESQKERVQKLFALGVSAGRERDLAEAAQASARAALASARADLQRAQLDLSYTRVRAPIAGITGREVRSEGSLVDAEDETSLLTTIAQSDRLFVDLAMPEAEARLVRSALQKDPEAVRLRLRLASGTEIAAAAAIEFLDARVDPDTGTVALRATIANAAAELSPGQFVQARLEGLSSGEGIYAPVRAIMYGTDGPFVWKLDTANAVSLQPVVLGEGVGNLVLIASGLTAGDRIIVDGVLKVGPGVTVKPVAVALDSRPAAVTERS